MKVCSSCGNAKAYDAFARRSSAPDGHASYCRECQAIYTKVWREKNAARIKETKAADYAANRSSRRAQQAEYRTSNPELIAEGKKRWRQENAEANREYWRRYRAANHEAIREYNEKWKTAHPETYRGVVAHSNNVRREAIKSGMTSRELRDWLSYQLMSCAYCHVDCALDFHIDHFVPIARGGTHEHENLRIACPTCNLRKNSRDPYEFMESLRVASFI
jgi:5-methylcytosine-specific restriction endonuclease McrA